MPYFYKQALAIYALDNRIAKAFKTRSASPNLKQLDIDGLQQLRQEDGFNDFVITDNPNAFDDADPSTVVSIVTRDYETYLPNTANMTGEISNAFDGLKITINKRDDRLHCNITLKMNMSLLNETNFKSADAGFVEYFNDRDRSVSFIRPKCYNGTLTTNEHDDVVDYLGMPAPKLFTEAAIATIFKNAKKNFGYSFINQYVKSDRFLDDITDKFGSIANQNIPNSEFKDSLTNGELTEKSIDLFNYLVENYQSTNLIKLLNTRLLQTVRTKSALSRLIETPEYSDRVIEFIESGLPKSLFINQYTPNLNLMPRQILQRQTERK